MEIKVIKRKFRKAYYSPELLNSIINHFLTPQNKDPLIIPSSLFEKSKPLVNINMGIKFDYT